MTLKTITPVNPSTSGSPSNNGTSSPTGGGSDSNSNPSKTNVGAIAGGAVAGVAAVALGLLGAMMLRRHRQKRKGPQLSPNPTKLPLTSTGNLEEGRSSPQELMDHNRVSGGGGYAAELPAAEVAREIYTRHRNGLGK